MKKIKQLSIWLTIIVGGLLGTATAEPRVIHLQKADKRIDVFGTIHIAKPDFYPLPKAVLHDVASADALAVEMDLSDAAIQRASGELMIKAAMTPDTQPLDAARLAKLNALFDAKMGKVGGEPWFLAIAIALERADALGFTEVGIDETLILQAKSQQKPIVSLEKPAEQIGVFSQIPYRESLQLFDDAVSDEFIQEQEMMTRVWRDNDAGSAKKIQQKMQAETPVLYRLINTERNRVMAKRITQYSERYPHLFVAIGAFHLYGDDSVVALLQQQGWRETAR